MINTSDLGQLTGADAIDNNGEKIGSVGQVYVDQVSAQPTWMSVRTGLFGMSESFVPLDQATWEGGTVRVPFDKEFVKDAPRVDLDGGDLSTSEEESLYRYYGMEYGGFDDTMDPTYTDSGTTGYDTSGPNTDSAMTRSEEQLHVGTERVETGRARLRKYVVTENQSVTVPVSHEEVRLEREPITEGNVGAAMSGPDISEEEHEVILTEERPVIAKETVPVERVRLDTETVTEHEQVNAEVRKEEIELDGDVDGEQRRF